MVRSKFSGTGENTDKTTITIMITGGTVVSGGIDISIEETPNQWFRPRPGDYLYSIE